MNWVWLCIAGVFEVCWAVGMKYSHGFTRLYPSVFTAAAMLASLGFLALAMRSLPLGTAYAVWTGIGAVGSVAVGILIFKEPVTAARMFFTVLLLTGIVGIKLTSSH